MTRRLEKNCQFFSKIAPKVAESKKGQNIYYKGQFESPKHLQQTTFETLKVANWQEITQFGHPAMVKKARAFVSGLLFPKLLNMTLS